MATSFELNADKTTATVSHFFKAAQKPGSAADAAKVKRASIKFAFDAVVEGGRIDADIAMIVNESLAQYGKRLIAGKASDWDYVPTAGQVTIPALAAELRKVSERGVGVLAPANLVALSVAYTRWAVDVASMGEGKAAGGAGLVRTAFKDVLGNKEVLAVFKQRMDSFVEWLVEAPEDASIGWGLEAQYGMEMLGEVAAALMDKLDTVLSAGKITALDL